MPPTSLAETKPVSKHVHAWRGQAKHHGTAGPMAVQQQQREREPIHQRLPQQRGGVQQRSRDTAAQG